MAPAIEHSNFYCKFAGKSSRFPAADFYLLISKARLLTVQNEGPLSARTVHIHAAPPPVPCRPHDGAHGVMFGVAQLQPVGAQELTECSDVGAQSMHAAGRTGWTAWLRLNAGLASEAANARSGQGYQVPVRGHQPRA